MKKKLLFLFAAIMTICTVTITSYAYSVGDINSDNIINAKDALSVLKHAAKLQPLSNDVAKFADIDWDGNVNATDALLILKSAAKLEELPDNNPYFYDIAENNGFMMNKLPYTSNGITINSVSSVDKYGYMSINYTNNTGKAIGDYSSYKVKLYNVDNEMIRETYFSLQDLDKGETGVSRLLVTDNTYKVVFASAKNNAGVSVSGIATGSNGGIVTNKLPYTIAGITVNSISVDKNAYVTLTAQNNTGKAVTSSSCLMYKCYDSNGYVVKTSVCSLKDINNGQSCQVNFYLAEDTAKMLIYDASLRYDENASNVVMGTYNGISVNKLPYTDSNKLTINSIKFNDYNETIINVSNNTGKAIKGTSYISYKCMNASGTVVKTGTVNLLYMNNGENCNAKFYKSDDTTEILFYESKIYEGTAIASVATATYDGITVNKLPADFGGLKLESISIADSKAALKITNNTGKAVSHISYINYRCLDNNGTIIKDSSVNVLHMNKGEKCKTSFSFPEGTAKIIFYKYSVTDTDPSPAVSTSNYSGIAMNSVPCSSNGLKINSYTVDEYRIKISVTNETGEAIKSNSNISFKCYDSEGYVISSSAFSLNNMNSGDTYEAGISRYSGVAKIVLYGFDVRN